MVRKFYIHIGVFIVVNAGLLVINLSQTPTTLWALFVTAGWGVALGLHGLSPFFGEEPMQTSEEGDEELSQRHRKAS